ncbi:DNA ligase D [Oceanobacillus halophilus]|uniref:DNA ligase (ATP) n=1 Tax=Oceanobacillus halophilus TaxID=930130 RepID=A0A495A1B9_9BACI|nr:DNA ligase D [Oceanobacillus halophilus]RKQ31522.1 DNA ligase D [Oceanobacillus halophilus]
MEMMKPIPSTEIPRGEEWLYEVKYDGFRCVLTWDTKGKITLTSKNNKELTANFPEIVANCQELEPNVLDKLPIKMDGEMVVLNNPFQANFSWIQKRGRLKNTESIQKASNRRPASFMAFDLLQENGSDLLSQPFNDRKKALNDLFKEHIKSNRIQYVNSYEDPEELWKKIYDHKGEGMIAKRKKSKYIGGKGHRDWFKMKNWRSLQGFLTHYDNQNGYYSFRVFDGNKIHEVGKCKHGLDDESAETLRQLFITNGEKSTGGYSLPPAICASIHSLDLYKNELREPEFVQLLPQVSAQECTIEKLMIDLAMIPERIGVSKTEKYYWPEKKITKGDLLFYIREISPYMLPFLKERALTLIRCPDGVEEEHFYQKHLPDYAPDFIDSLKIGNDRIIICNDMDSLVWFANHGGLEYHVPFQTVNKPNPLEIVFDLDPPNRERFDLAIQAANIIKPLLDDLELISFVKTSGNKGIQIHIPIPENSLTYDDTAVFTQAIAYTVEGAYPNLFTTERMKKKRNGRLYIDYVQHGKDKTIIAPYSPRMTKEGSIATPLFWEEVNEDLTPEKFTVKNTLDRVQELGCPFADFFEVRNKQNLDKVMKLIKD